MSIFPLLSEVAGWSGTAATGRCCGIARGEILIAPADAIAWCAEETLARCVGGTLHHTHSMHLTCGDYVAVVLAQGDFQDLGATPFLGHVCVTEGLWPKPVGLRLTLSFDGGRGSWTLESDRYGLRPIYYGLDWRHRPIVSTRPEVVAALTGSGVAARSVAECLLVGYTLDSHSLFEGVNRLRPRERLVYDEDCGFTVNCIPVEQETLLNPDRSPHTVESLIQALTPTIVEAFERDFALELSGSVDSRLVLAMGLNAGIKPTLAFTLGHDGDEDVEIARIICKQNGLEHEVLPAEIDPDRIADDGFAFVRRAGFAVNACSYAWLPRVFERLSSLTSGQIGGGECAAGYYYSRLDACCQLRRIQEMWVHRRLFARGVAAAELFGADRAEALEAEVTETALRLLRWSHGSWRQRTDELYLTQRVPNAGGAVLSASACWHELLQPLLHEPYVEWGRGLGTGKRAGQRMQMKIIHELDPQLGAVPYSTKKIKRRRRRPANGSGAALVGDDRVVGSLRGLAEREGMSVEHVERMTGEPDRFEHELGTLLSTAWAAESAREIADELALPMKAAPLRRAA